ncbi:MAG: hypothetical protein HIU88_06910 [Acidobacteria bacterium]|nr:hypothetical protein [Acidobacteriota bacterium]
MERLSRGHNQVEVGVERRGIERLTGSEIEDRLAGRSGNVAVLRAVRS